MSAIAGHRGPVADPARRARALEAAGRAAAPTRAEVRRRRSLAPPLAAVAMLAVLFLWGGPAHLAGRPLAVSAWIVVGLAALAAVVTLLVLPDRAMRPRPAGQLAALAVVVPVAVAAWLLAWHAAYEDPFTRAGLRCVALTAAAAPWPFLAIRTFLPRFAPLRPRLWGAALGASAGAWAALLVELWCPLAAAGHVLVGHALPVAGIAAAGALLGRRLLGLRRT